MSLYVIGDMHLSFSTDKPMDIFGWGNHAEKIRNNWIEKVTDEDTVVILGDFSWATYIGETYEDFKFLNSLPGKKILAKGNHDYWWTTVTCMKKYVEENNFVNIDFLYNNSYLIDNKVIVGTRGWVNSWRSDSDYKILKRENDRLKLSIESGIKKYGSEKEIISFIHYPPFYREPIVPEEIDFIKTLNRYNIKKCYYAHLHGDSHAEALEGIIDGIDYKLVSADYLNFNLFEIK